MSNLILTGFGWSEYAVAAAVALKGLDGKSDVAGVSKRRLPEYLEALPGDWKRIYIVGVSLGGDEERLANALKRLKAKGVQVSWISAYAPSESQQANVLPHLKAEIGNTDTLLEAVGRFFSVDVKPFVPFADEGKKVPCAVRDYHELLEAAQFAYRNYQDEVLYATAIRYLATGIRPEAWSDEVRQAIAHYRRYGGRELVGKSPQMRTLQERINRVAQFPDARVLILGESGTGKETVAQQIHNKSPRKREPFYAFNCASVNPDLLESRFFGHEKGAYTGADKRELGLFELANGGTLFLDEIGELPLSISPVEDMFRWVDERWVCGDTNGIPSRTGSPWNNPDSECDGRHFIFVHGYDVNVQSARGWAAEMFKRLWQAGSRSKFTAVDWYGNDSEIPGWVPKYGGEAPNYYANVEHAFATASRFVQDCGSLPGSKVILAHSLGNMLVSSAIKDHSLTDYSKYYMLNAAVPMEAYDRDAESASMIDHDWRAVSNRVYSSEWWRLFSSGDARVKLTWRERFVGIANAINCYSTTEDTLGNAGLDEWLVGRWWRDKYWAMQELNKGTAYASAAPESWMHCEGGWGYNPYYARKSGYVTHPNRRMTARFRKAISKLSDEDLKRHPVFRPFDESWLCTTNFISAAAISAPVRARILADGIPATSFAAGANPLSKTVIGNIDYAACKTGTDWPRKDGLWLHSDIKNLAFRYNYLFFEKIVNGETK